MGSNPDVIFSRETFDNELQKFGKFGMLMAIMVLPIFTSEANEIPDMDEIAEKFGRNEEIKESDIQFNTKTVDAYNKRMTGVFEDMHRLHYI